MVGAGLLDIVLKSQIVTNKIDFYELSITIFFFAFIKIIVELLNCTIIQ